MTVEVVIVKIEKINHYLEDLDKADIVTYKEGDLMMLSDILTEYRDMLLAMKVKTN